MPGSLADELDALPEYLSPAFHELIASAAAELGTARTITVPAIPDRDEGESPQRLLDVKRARDRLHSFLTEEVDALEQIGDMRLRFQSRESPDQIAERVPAKDLPDISAGLIALAETRKELRSTIEVDLGPGPGGDPGPVDPIGGGGPGGPGGPGGIKPGPGGKPKKLRRTSVLPRYNGPTVAGPRREQLLALRRLLRAGPERTFRLGVLRGEAHIVQQTLPAAILEYDRLLTRDLSDQQRRFAAVRCGFAHLAHGDGVFRAARGPDDPDRSIAAASYGRAVAVVRDNGVAEGDPRRQHIEEHAAVQQAKLEAGLTFIGYRDSYVPILRPETLLGLAERRIARAEDAIGRFELFTSKAEQIQDKLADLRFDADIKEIEEDIAQEQLARARDQRGIADTRIDQIEDQLSALDLTSGVGAAGFALQAVASGVMGGSGGGGGTSIPGVAGAISGFASTAAGYFARQDDLRNQRIIAKIERRIAGREIRIAELQQEITATTLEFLGDKISRIQDRELNPQVYLAAAEEFRAMAVRHLDAAVTWSFLFERAVAFLRLVDIRTIRLDYLPLRKVDDDGNMLTAAAQLASDLEDVVAANVPITKFQHLTETYSLRALHPLEFASFLQTGVMDFAISLYEQNKARPGVFRQRIKGLAVELVGLVPTTGFTGRITHHGSFLLRDRDTTPEPGEGRLIPEDDELEQALEALQEGASQGVPVGGVMVFLLDEDRLELSAETPPPNIGDPAPEALNIFEGYGQAGSWTLEIDNIDLRNIVDVRLRITYVIPESDGALSDKVKGLVASYEQELLEDDTLQLQGDALDLISPFSLQGKFPDVLAQLASGEAELTLERSDFPAGITDLKLKTVIAQALDGEARGVEGIDLALMRPGTALDLRRVTSSDGFTEKLGEEIPLLPSEERFPVEGAYTLRVAEPAQAELLADLLLFFVYEFREG